MHQNKCLFSSDDATDKQLFLYNYFMDAKSHLHWDLNCICCSHFFGDTLYGYIFYGSFVFLGVSQRFGCNKA
jgi:hypothetical protein